ncbi:hypothetical protein [Acidisoma cladoniae]|jgi:hypothetical protein|uniref:hypothetical protein n=1 Tax=Acidisoma cladoniae TaxID=3040935 RepID=UPI00254E2D18|nr:hypothetical protein [Acidisoma sp. PAMC 29798]
MRRTERVGIEIWRFLLLGVLTMTIAMTIWDIGTVVNADFLHHNPNRSPRDSWDMVEEAPLVMFVIALAVAALPVAVAATAAGLSRVSLGRVPVSILVTLLPICILLSFLQSAILLGGAGEPSDHIYATGRLAIFFVPMLVAFWLFGRRPSAPVSSPSDELHWEHDDPVTK